MATDRVYLTRSGYDKLKKELDNLKLVERRSISLQIKEAREQGDLSENAEYDAAKEKQGRIEGKIVQLEDKLGRAIIINADDFDAKEVRIGCTVKLLNLENNTEVEYTLVDVSEADFSKGKISINSPVGQGLVGSKIGETAEIKLPAKTLNFKIIEIKREDNQ
jgi:transcription elongation factor GreA